MSTAVSESLKKSGSGAVLRSTQSRDAPSGVQGQSPSPSFLDFKNRLVASPAFQRWATRFPLTRPFARRNAAALFDIGAGFIYSQILTACLQLRLFEVLRPGALPVADIAGRIGLDAAAADRLLRAAAALDLVASAGADRYRLGMLGAALLGNPGASAMFGHHGHLYADLADPVALLRRTQGPGTLASYWPYAAGADPSLLSGEQVGAYSALMAASNAMIADQVLAAYPVRRHKLLLDVGGGEGAFLRAAAATAPDLRLTLFDLPAVAQRAELRFAEADLSARAQVQGGDFFTGTLPAGADLISLIRVVHDHDDDKVRALLRNVRRALPPGGTVLLAEPMAGRHGAPRVADAYFGFYLLAMGSGQARTPETLCAMLQDSGFVHPRRVRTGAPMLTGLIVARG